MSGSEYVASPLRPYVIMTATIHDGNDIGIMHPLATDAVALKERRTLFERIARRRKGSKRRAYVVERGKRFVR